MTKELCQKKHLHVIIICIKLKKRRLFSYIKELLVIEQEAMKLVIKKKNRCREPPPEWMKHFVSGNSATKPLSASLDYYWP